MALSKGFHHNALNDIQAIRANLGDRYPTDSVIKELLQNADDAQDDNRIATEFHVAWIPGLSEVDHPLLKGPLLFFINNGPFTSANAEAIRNIGLSDKAGRKSAVGRFGLGLKSVFNLCEAFFFAGSDLNAVRDGDECDVLNPWSPDFHTEWDELSETSKQAIRRMARTFVSSDRWFCICIPLRRLIHVLTQHPIIADYPGDFSLFPRQILHPGIETKLSTVVPFLKHIESISGWMLDDVGSPTEVFGTKLLSGIRCEYPNLRGNERRHFSGQAIASSADNGGRKTGTHDFAGIEVLLEDTAFNELQDSHLWPSSSSIDPKTGKPEEDKERMDPHCAVCFSKREEEPENEHQLNIEWLVFLPLGQQEIIRCSASFCLALHGYFFVDPGRKAIDFGPVPDGFDRPSTESAVRHKWNRLLANKGMFPLVLPALDHFTKKVQLTEGQLYDLVHCIKESDLFEKHRSTICGEYQWIYELSDPRPSWRLIEAGARFYTIPDPSSKLEPGTFGHLFPQLINLAVDNHITFGGYPSLTNSMAARWTGSMLVDILQVNVGAIFEKAQAIDYFADLLEHCGQKALQQQDVSTHMIRFATRVLIELSVADLRANRAKIERILGLVPPNRRVTVGRPLSLALQRIIGEISLLSLDVLIVPKDFGFKEDNLSSGGISVQDGVRIMHILRNLSVESDDDEDFAISCSHIALQVFDLQKQHKDDLVDSCGHFRLFRATNQKEKVKGLWSFNDLLKAYRAGILFVTANQAPAAGLSDELQQCIQDPVMLIEPEAARILFTEKKVSSCDSKACVDVLNKIPTLNADPQLRRSLLETLISRPSSIIAMPAQAKPIRYLLHGCKEHFDHNAVLLVNGSVSRQNIWQKIVTEALRQTQSEWRLIPNTAGDLIPRNVWGSLGINELDIPTIVELVKAAKPECIVFADATDQERKTLFTEIDDLAILKRLRIHESTTGDFVTIDPKTYLQSSFALEKELLSTVTIVRKYEEENLSVKQRQMMPLLDAESAITIALAQEQPQLYRTSIMNWLFVAQNILRAELVVRLAQVPWLLTKNQRPVAPADIICLSELGDDVDRIVATTKGDFLSTAELADDLICHKAFPVLERSVFPPRVDALAMLGQMMGLTERYFIGAFDNSRFDLDDFLQAFEGLPLEVLPSYHIIRAVCERISPDECKDSLIPELLRQIPDDRLVQIFNFLSSQWERGSKEKKEILLRVFNAYLATIEESKFDVIVKQIRLLNRSGKWRDPADLCFEGDSLNENNLLDRLQGQIIQRTVLKDLDLRSTSAYIPKSVNEPESLNLALTAGRLKEYFSPWDGILPRGAIGGFLCVLGDDPQIVRLAEAYLENRSVGNTRESFEWKPLPVNNVRMVVGAGEDIHQAMERQRFFVEVVDSDSVEVPNVFGDVIAVSLSGRFDTIFVAGGGSRGFEGYRVKYLRVRRINPKDFTSVQLCTFLSNSVKELLKSVYCQEILNFDLVWQDLIQSEQLDITIAQNLILESGFFYLRQLGVHTDGRIKEIMNKWEDARHRKAEEEFLRSRSSKTINIRESGASVKEAQEQLRTLIEEDVETRNVIIHAIREKIGKHYQYQLDSIPFELFQNADDAVVELANMVGDTAISAATKNFTIAWSEDRIFFMHWGRHINQYWMGDFTAGRERGYDRDLEKMLVLSSSDKVPETISTTNAVTGKFGLGFKSIFLSSDCPRILSGNLGFEIVGGFFPRILAGQDYSELREQMLALGSETRIGTIIDARLRENVTQSQLLGKFRQLIGILLLFSKRIRYCQFHELKGGKTETISWEENALPGTKQWFIGGLQAVPETSIHNAVALVLRAELADLLLILDARGFVSLPKQIPTIWVTEPTLETGNTGFALNAKFDLDIGRAQLAKTSDNNRRLADSIGTTIGDAILELYQACKNDWTSFCSSLHLAEGLDQYSFWHSFWKIMAADFVKIEPTEGSSSAIDLLRTIFWATDQHGIRKAFAVCHIVPSGLSKKYCVLTRTQAVRHAIFGLLESQDVFENVCQWESFQERLPIGTVVSGSVWNVLNKLVPRTFFWNHVRLQDIIEWETTEGKDVDNGKATRFASIINKEFLDRAEGGGESIAQEITALRHLLQTLRFRARDDEYYLAKSLLVAVDEKEYQDEHLRAEFAPTNRILADDYFGPSLEFFRICRTALMATAEEMATWVLNAETRQKRLACLFYILNGELGRQLSLQLIDKADGTWLSSIVDSGLIEGFDEQERGVILGRLRLIKEPVSMRPVAPVAPNSSLILRSIYDWWHEEGDARIKEYERRVYPEPYAPYVNWLCKDMEFLSKDAEKRESWLALFSLASFYTLGRTTQEQNRDFLGLCRREKWLVTLSEPHMNHENWTKVIIDYVDRQADEILYYHWMRNFIGMLILSTWLTEYIAVFLQSDKLTEPFSLDTILKTRTSSIWQSGGPEAPPITRVLGIGVSFVLRELVRCGIISNSNLHKYCYVPTGGVRRIIAAAGCEDISVHNGSKGEASQAILIFLANHLGTDQCTFNSSFDLPFSIIARDPALQYRFFNEAVPIQHDLEEEVDY